jgi:hypothetical protein
VANLCLHDYLSKQGGVPMSEAKIVITTAGMAARWCASYGEGAFWSCRGVFFDELGQMEQDPEYAPCFDAALQVREGTGTSKRFVLVGAGSALSTGLQTRLTDLGTECIRCCQRPYPVQQSDVTVSSRDCLNETIAHIGASLLRRGGTSLIFLPGKTEIEDVARILEKLNVCSSIKYAGSTVN